MELNLKCMEWTNMNKSARLIKSNKNGKKQQKQNDLANSSIYLLQIAGYKNDNKKLGCLSSDQIINVYDQSNLKLISQIKNLNQEASNNININEIGFFKQTDNMMFSCSDNGKLKCWDLRNHSLEQQTESGETICFSSTSDDKREFLCADINSSDNLLSVGTNKTIDDALIYIFDIRFNSKYLQKFSESHSNDVTQLKFDPNKPSKFSSSSLDGLVCLYDLDQEPDVLPKSAGNSDDSDSEEEDPDFMEQVFNADSSIHKLGYLSSSQDQNADQLYAITFTNDLFVWDLNTHDVVHKYQSKNKNIENGTSINVDDDQDEDYFFDCFYFKPNLMTICKGDKNGSFKLYQQNEIVFDSRSQFDKTERAHRDIIRSSYWNNEYLFTAGEDGFLFKWKLSDKSEKEIDSEEDKDHKQIQKREWNKKNDNTEHEQPENDDETEVKRNKKSNEKNFYSKKKKNYKNFKFSNKNSK